MKTFAIIMFFIVNSLNNQAKLLFAYEKGTVKIQKSFLITNFDLDCYYDGNGDYVEIFALKDKKTYLGSVSKSEYIDNEEVFIEKYTQNLKDSNKGYSESKAKQFLRVEHKDEQVLFYYHEQLVNLNFGSKLNDNRYCVSGYNSKLEIRERYFKVAIYINKELKFVGNIIKDNDQNVIKVINITSDFAISEVKLKQS
jgi:hypothetical protein